MAAAYTIVNRVRLLIRDVLSVDPASNDTDLITTGLLDSLALVAMIAELENEFALELPLDDLDVECFRSVGRIARFLAELLPMLP
jgi:acyl carrier protein